VLVLGVGLLGVVGWVLGGVQETELRQILGNLGDSLTTQEVNSLLREVKVGTDGGIDYTLFVDMLVNAYPVGDKL
jgi:Ca2+-binding EF-hand superfamily protein